MKNFMMKSVVLMMMMLMMMMMMVKGQNPGFEFGVSQAGLQVIEKVTVMAINADLQGVPLPDPSPQKVLSPIGFVNISITNLVLQSVVIPSYTVAVVEGVGFSLSLNKASIALTFDWRWRQDLWPHDDGHGTGTGSSDATITATVRLGVSAQLPTAQVSAMKIDLSDFKFHLSGGVVSWLLDLFVDTFKFIIKDIVQGELNSSIPPIINQQLASALGTFPTSVAVPFLTFYFPFYSFTATSDLISWGMEGLASAPGTPVNLSPFSAPAMPVEIPPATMAQVFVSDFMFNTALYTLFSQGLLSFSIAQSQLPPADQGLLNTSSWKSAVPALYKAYPDAPMQLVFAANSTPSVSISPSTGANATIPGFMTVNVPGSGTAFVLQGDIYFAINVSIVANSIHLAIESVDVSFSLYSSNIGQFSVLPLRALIKSVLSVGIPVVNKLLAPGLPIPSIAGLSLVDPEIVYGNGYFMIGSDITYVGQPSHEFREK